MTTFALDENHDRYISSGDTAMVTDLDEVVQKIDAKFRHYFGEWWLKLDSGVPWFQKIFVSPGNIGEIERVLKEVITSTPGVTSLVKFDADVDAKSRRFSVIFEADTDFGETGEVTIA